MEIYIDDFRNNYFAELFDDLNILDIIWDIILETDYIVFFV